MVKEWARQVQEEAAEIIDPVTMPSYDGGLEIEGLVLFLNTITIQPVKRRPVAFAAHDPFRYELRIEVGPALLPPAADERSGNIATHAILISNYEPSRAKTDFGVVEFIKGCEPECATVCLLGEQEMKMRRIPTSKIDRGVAGEGGKAPLPWLVELNKCSLMEERNGEKLLGVGSCNLGRAGDIDFKIFINNNEGYEGGKRLLIFYSLDSIINDGEYGLKTIRDIQREHLPLLKKSIENVKNLIAEGRGHPTFRNFSEYNCYFHYPPSANVLHLHVVHKTCSDTDSEIGKTFLLQDVVTNVQRDESYYQKIVCLDHRRGNEDVWSEVFAGVGDCGVPKGGVEGADWRMPAGEIDQGAAAAAAAGPLVAAEAEGYRYRFCPGCPMCDEAKAGKKKWKRGGGGGGGGGSHSGSRSGRRGGGGGGGGGAGRCDWSSTGTPCKKAWGCPTCHPP